MKSMGDLFPKPGEKPWNLNSFGQPRWEKPTITYAVQVERRPADLQVEMTRFTAFHDRITAKLRELDRTHIVDPASLTIETAMLNGNPVYRATFDAKPRTEEP